MHLQLQSTCAVGLFTFIFIIYALFACVFILTNSNFLNIFLFADFLHLLCSCIFSLPPPSVSSFHGPLHPPTPHLLHHLLHLHRQQTLSQARARTHWETPPRLLQRTPRWSVWLQPGNSPVIRRLCRPAGREQPGKTRKHRRREFFEADPKTSDPALNVTCVQHWSDTLKVYR